ncbi:hypothetical protein Tco_0504833 [Tanacetum coccineum]
MTTPRPTPFRATTPRAGVLIPFVIISDSDDEVTTLPVRPAPPSLDYVPDLLDYSSDSDLDPDLSEDASLVKDSIETAESLHTRTALTSIVHSPSTRPLPTIPAFVRRPGKEIPTSSPSLLPSSSSPSLLVTSSSIDCK